MEKVKSLIEKLQMLPHPEGGYYKETYRCGELIEVNGFEGTRNVSTAIYYLLDGENFSAFHKIKSDEMWHFYEGGGLYIHVIDLEGNYTKLSLGMDLENGQLPQHLVPANSWFASENIDNSSYSLVGCTVAPGFDFQDFEMAERAELLKLFPSNEALVKKLTRD